MLEGVTGISRFIYASLLAFMILLLAGCSQTPLRMYPPAPYEQYDLKASVDGINISVKPVINGAELKHYLGIDIFAEGILSIFVELDNTNDDTSFLVSESTFGLGKQVTETERGPASENAGTAVVVGSLFTPLIMFPPVALTGISMANNASRKNLNIERNGFPNGTLSPRESEQGFAYFKVPKDVSDDLVFTVHLKNLDTKKVVSSRFEFNLDMKAR
jgi:hypothetical protein